MLGNHEVLIIYEHMLRLSQRDRSFRFCGSADDKFIAKYCYRRQKLKPLTLGFFVDNQLRGLGELFVGPAEQEQDCCEIALSVETPCQNHKVGTTIFEKLLLFAQESGTPTVYMFSLPENHPIQKITQKYGGSIRNMGNLVEVKIPLNINDGISSEDPVGFSKYLRHVA